MYFFSLYCSFSELYDDTYVYKNVGGGAHKNVHACAIQKLHMYVTTTS